MAKYFWGLAKIFTSKEHAEQFMAGRLLLRKLSFFTNAESKISQDANRHDHNETACAVFPEDTKCWLDDIQLQLVTPPPPIRKKVHELFYCMSKPRICYDQKKISIGKGCEKFGKYIVFISDTNVNEFYKKITSHQNFIRKGDIIYIDFKTHFGTIDDFIFKKDTVFEYQQEYRFMFKNNNNREEDFIDIGSIENICKLCEQ
jgi:hypothetical protein